MKKLIIFLFLCLLFLPSLVIAQDSKITPDIIFKAVVIEVIKEQNTTLPDGTTAKQQDVKLRGLEGEYKDKIVEFNGIGDFDVIKKNIYRVGDKVLVDASTDDRGNTAFYITDYVRVNSLWLLAAVFILSILIVGRLKGFRSLLSLCLTFLIIMKYIVPQILNGGDPVFISVIGSFGILISIIYLTEGFKVRSHVSAISIFASLLITVFLSWLFVGFAKLSGLSNEESSFLVGISKQAINFQGLLLAGIIIGALGVLDDIVIAQVASVEELNEADKYQSKWELYTRAYKIGVSHISSMTNTLFLAYAGASLPLLVLFGSGQSGFSTWGQAVNNEMMATEIVRTLAGSVGLILSVPIATFIATWWVKRKRS